MMSSRISRTSASAGAAAHHDASGGLRVTQHGGEGLIELVRHRRRQLTHARHHVHVGELVEMALRVGLERACEP